MKTKAFISIIIAVIAIWGLSFISLFFFKDWSERGQFGDLFGSVNALFSGLAFAGLIYAILLQRKELSLQREELRLQREEMAASRQELAAQVSAQEALFQATVGQIRVAADQARIEAEKMAVGNIMQGAARTQHTQNVAELAKKIEKIADKIQPYDKDLENK
jgi:hypothetical protein